MYQMLKPDITVRCDLGNSIFISEKSCINSEIKISRELTSRSCMDRGSDLSQ